MAINLMIWPSTGGGRGITFPGLKNSISCVYLDADRTRSPVSLKTGGREGLERGVGRRVMREEERIPAELRQIGRAHV